MKALQMFDRIIQSGILPWQPDHQGLKLLGIQRDGIAMASQMP
jgi:hypothetical protein